MESPLAEEGDSVRPIAVVAAPIRSDASSTDLALHELFVERFLANVLPKLEIPYETGDVDGFSAARERYRVALFVWADRVASPLRPVLREWLEQPGRTAVWFHAPGWEDEEGESLSHCQELTGILVNADPMTNGLEVALTNFRHPFTSGLERKVSFGSGQLEPYRFRPHFYADDGLATILGRLVGSDKPGLVVKKVGQGRSVYMAAPLPPPELLRRICLAGIGAD